MLCHPVIHPYSPPATDLMQENATQFYSTAYFDPLSLTTPPPSLSLSPRQLGQRRHREREWLHRNDHERRLLSHRLPPPTPLDVTSAVPREGHPQSIVLPVLLHQHRLCLLLPRCTSHFPFDVTSRNTPRMAMTPHVASDHLCQAPRQPPSVLACIRPFVHHTHRHILRLHNPLPFHSSFLPLTTRRSLLASWLKVAAESVSAQCENNTLLHSTAMTPQDVLSYSYATSTTNMVSAMGREQLS